MGNVKVLTGVPRIGGVGTPSHSNWQPGVDVLVDPDGNPIYSTANPPPGGGGGLTPLGFDRGFASTSRPIGGSVTITLLNAITPPPGTKLIIFDCYIWQNDGATQVRYYGQVVAELESGDNQIRGLYVPDATQYAGYTDQAVIGAPSPTPLIGQTSCQLRITAWNPATKTYTIGLWINLGSFINPVTGHVIANYYG